MTKSDKLTDIYKTHPEANFLQTTYWGKVNELLGHKVANLDFKNGNSALCIVKDAKRGRYLEVPGGPLINWGDKKLIKTAFTEIYNLAKQEKCVFVRFRPQLLDTPENQKIIGNLEKVTGLHFCPAPFHLHAQNTVILDLEKTEDELLADMRRQTRYEVRKAEKLALKVEKSHSEEMYREFHATQVETAKRRGFIPPTEEDLLAYHEVFGDKATLYKVTTTKPISADGKKVIDSPEEHLATTGASLTTSPVTTGARKSSSEGDVDNFIAPNSVICYGLIITDGPEAEYFEAASTELGLKLPGASALQWQVIKDLKAQGIKRYNLWGIAPPDPEHPGEHLKNHRYSRVTTFKTGFGGTQTNFIPATDLIVAKNRYRLTYLFETLRKKRRHLV